MPRLNRKVANCQEMTNITLGIRKEPTSKASAKKLAA